MASLKNTEKKQEPKEKQEPKPCKCGKPALVVRKVGGYVISCPKPEDCKGNYFASARTKGIAIANWNLIV